jgi:Domain of unknown function (DUF6602)
MKSVGEMHLNLGQEGGQILKSFRTVAKSHVELFRAQRDRVHQLLGGRHNYSSGAFREGLLRSFLASTLPKSVSVDSGFIYGFDQVENSRQIDILVWDSSRHSAVFRAGDFVIVSPESVIAALAVKSKLDSAQLRDALENLQSVVPLDCIYRSKVSKEGGQLLHRSILKIVVAYESIISEETTLKAVREYYEEIFASNAVYANAMAKILSDIDPFHPSQEHTEEAGRFLPMMIASIETNEMSFIRGWGPASDNTAHRTYGPGLRRLPFIYAQEAKLTTPLEKLVYHVLEATYLAIGTIGWSLVSAWGEINPVTGFRFGDAGEIVEQLSARLMDPDKLTRNDSPG